MIANVERVSKLFLSKTAYSIAIALSFGLLNLQFPFLPRQLSFTDGLHWYPSFFLALMANCPPTGPASCAGHCPSPSPPGSSSLLHCWG